MISQADPRGSVWRRWDPHIHAPGTALSNQFGPDDWDAYIDAIEKCEPKIEALGITDYYSLDDYERVCGYQEAGRLPDVGLIFPNIELRLPTATRNAPVNIHLLVSPEDSDHLAEAKRFLATLTFEYRGESYRCDRSDLVKLGRAHDATIIDEGAALRAGTNLFKVTLENLKESFSKSSWAQRNILIAVAGGSGDGTSGVRDDESSLQGVRIEIERIAHVIFSASPQQRKFWTGEGVLGVDALTSTYGGRKLCLHGSDAHRLDRVGVPDEARYTWIKGDASFESLRQAYLEPGERAVVATLPPQGAMPYRVIDRIRVTNAEWMKNSEIQLSSGLVAIIGARGSGKTALADLIAAGAGAASQEKSDKTFLQRARAFLPGSSVELEWGDGRASAMPLPPSEPAAAPGVQYLSQQFVERLCSSEGITDELLREIERVIFEAHPHEERLGASTFQELLALRAGHGRGLRQFANQQIEELSNQIDQERTAQRQVAALETETKRLTDLLVEDRKARSSLVVVGGEARASRLEAIIAALAFKQGSVDALRRQEQSLGELSESAKDLIERRLPTLVSELARNHAPSGLTSDEWNQFKLAFVGNPSALLAQKLTEVRTQIAKLTGATPMRQDVPASEMAPFVDESSDLSQATLNTLKAEAWRLGQVIGLDSAKQKQLQALNAKIASNEALLLTTTNRLSDAQGARARIDALSLQRKQAYASLFDGYASEQRQLEEMYSPLHDILTDQKGTLGKLTFSVKRVVDVRSWALQGESLLDLRTGEFRGHGELERIATDTLLPAWESGTSGEVAEAMAAFRARHDLNILQQAKVPTKDAAAYQKWARAVSAWLNSTDHILVRYGILYDGVEIEQLSPGTRGIVLLLLYLAVDQTDDRPLVIDQPEENLDPKSIFDELVHRFVETRNRRQIIIVTHNANLVVNTDADQVIIANAGSHRPGRLPELTYVSGALENPLIRAEVCEILEGGRPAFEERAKRLRISLA